MSTRGVPQSPTRIARDLRAISRVSDANRFQSFDRFFESLQRRLSASARNMLASDLVKDAIQIIRESRVDEIPVVSDDGEPVGVIDVQDLVSLRLIES